MTFNHPKANYAKLAHYKLKILKAIEFIDIQSFCNLYNNANLCYSLGKAKILSENISLFMSLRKQIWGEEFKMTTTVKK